MRARSSVDASRVVHVGKVGGIGGSEKHLLDLLPLLPERGFPQTMIVLHAGEPGAEEFAGELERRGVAAELMRMRSGYDGLVLGSLVSRLRSLRPAIVHTHLVHADVLGLPAAAVARVPVRVTTKHGFDPFRHGRTFSALDRAVTRLGQRRIAISQGLVDYLVEVEGFRADEFVVVHYGVEPGPAPATEPESGLVVCVGRLIPIKGHETLLRAVARLRPHVPRLRLDLAGDGPLEQSLRTLAAQLGIGDVVRFLGRVRPVEPVLESASVVAVPSLGEGFGQVALEAMDRARPVVASRAGGLPEIVVDGETGLTVPPGDAEALAGALRSLLADPDRARALGEAGRRRVIEEFAPERCADRTAAVYRDALAVVRRSASQA